MGSCAYSRSPFSSHFCTNSASQPLPSLQRPMRTSIALRAARSLTNSACWFNKQRAHGIAKKLEGFSFYNALLHPRSYLQCTCFDTKSLTFRRLLFLGTISLTLATYASAAQADMKIEAGISRFHKTQTGVKIEDVVEGSGPEAKYGDEVEFNCVCRRTNGYFVYSTVDQFSGESSPISTILGTGKVILGLEEVLQGMKRGGKRRALIPPNLGYIALDLEPQPHEFGPRRSLMSHANEPLFFEVQLLKVT